MNITEVSLLSNLSNHPGFDNYSNVPLYDELTEIIFELDTSEITVEDALAIPLEENSIVGTIIPFATAIILNPNITNIPLINNLTTLTPTTITRYIDGDSYKIAIYPAFTRPSANYKYILAFMTYFGLEYGEATEICQNLTELELILNSINLSVIENTTIITV